MNTVIACMDGRVMRGGKLGLAGSGILLPRKGNLPQAKYMKILEKMVKNDEITAITWHGGCGAAALWVKNNGKDGKNSENEAKKFAEMLSRELTKRTGKNIEANETYAYGQHDEAGVYLDFTNALVVDDNMKNGFLLSPKLHGDVEYLLSEIEVAINIAFSDHGRNERHPFSKEEPFFIEIVSKEDLGVFRGIGDVIKEFVKHRFSDRAALITVDIVSY